MKSFLWIALFLSPAFGWAQQAAYRIEGKLGKVRSGATAYVRYILGESQYGDSALVQNGRFLITGAGDRPHQAWLIIDRRSVRFYLEPGTITVSSPDSIQDAVVGGTPMNEDNQRLKRMLQPTDQQLALIGNKLESVSSEPKTAGVSKADLEKQRDALRDEQQRIRAQFIRENPRAMLSLFTLQLYSDLYTPELSEVEPMYNHLADAIKTSLPGKAYAERLARMRATSVGATAPDFTQPDTAGKAVTLRSLRGQYVLVDFWASWCGPCRAENPNVVRNFNQYKDQNFTVLSISLDRDKALWLKAIQKDQLNWTHLSDLKAWDNESAKQYAIRNIPQNFLIDPNGKIVAINIRGEELGKTLANILNRKP